MYKYLLKLYEKIPALNRTFFFFFLLSFLEEGKGSHQSGSYI